MAKAIRGHNLGTTMAIALLAGLLVLVGLVFVVWQTTSTNDSVDTPAISADRDGGSSFTRDPYIEHHVAVVARYRNGADTPAMSQDSDEGSSSTREPYVDRHAEIVANMLR